MIKNKNETKFLKTPYNSALKCTISSHELELLQMGFWDNQRETKPRLNFKYPQIKIQLKPINIQEMKKITKLMMIKIGWKNSLKH